MMSSEPFLVWYTIAVSASSLGQVKNFISIGGPHAGTASVPLCGVSLLHSSQFITLVIIVSN
jgi:triacylglycerol esterase/lipase EstA (alpha/beta hydrolase family)